MRICSVTKLNLRARISYPCFQVYLNLEGCSFDGRIDDYLYIHRFIVCFAFLISARRNLRGLNENEKLILDIGSIDLNHERRSCILTDGFTGLFNKNDE